MYFFIHVQNNTNIIVDELRNNKVSVMIELNYLNLNFCSKKYICL